jgi:hypothetical protein
MVDPGISTFEKGVEGNTFEAKGNSASVDFLTILVNVVKDSIKTTKLFDGQGNKIAAIYNYSWSSLGACPRMPFLPNSSGINAFTLFNTSGRLLLNNTM